MPALEPLDEANRRLQSAVHPPDWVNPTPKGRYHLVVIGAGTAGLVTASVAAALGADVALIERGLMGGDCLNVGCVPSKSLLAAARVAHAARRAGDFGVRVPGDVTVDFPAVMDRMRQIRASIAPHDSASRFKKLGIDVFLGDAKFVGKSTVEVAGATLPFGRAVIATGARPRLPDVPGLAATGYRTNETIFSLAELPRRLAILGGGPIGCEMAQAFARFGSTVTILEHGPRLLPHDDPDAAAILTRQFSDEGIRLVFGAKVTKAERTEDGRRLTARPESGDPLIVDVDEILVATGRAPNVEGLGLEAAGVEFDTKDGVAVDNRLRTSNRRVYAAGDCCSKYKFTHAADFLARTVVRNALFHGRSKASNLVIPWCTYTEPEVAHVGLTPQQAEEQGVEIDTYTVKASDLDRARTESTTEGIFRAHCKKGTDKLVGVTIVDPHAGELIGEATTLLTKRIRLGAFASVVHPYPTRAEGLRKLGDAYNKTRLGGWTAWLLRSVIEWTI